MPQELLLETLTASYWNRNPQGTEALAFFIVIRSMLLIMDGVDQVFFEILMDDYIPYSIKELVVQQAEFVSKKMITARKMFLKAHDAVDDESLYDVALDEETKIRKAVFNK
jgi:hypothetical protein